MEGQFWPHWVLATLPLSRTLCRGQEIASKTCMYASCSIRGASKRPSVGCLHIFQSVGFALSAGCRTQGTLLQSQHFTVCCALILPTHNPSWALPESPATVTRASNYHFQNWEIKVTVWSYQGVACYMFMCQFIPVEQINISCWLISQGRNTYIHWIN